MRSWMVLVFLLSWVRSADAESFLTNDVIEQFESAPAIEAQLVDPMPFVPVFRPESFRYQTKITLTEAERNRLLTALRSASRIDPTTRLKECRYLPGITFSIKDATHPHTAILCLNCDVWALDSAHYQAPFDELQHPGSTAPRRLQRFGDSRPEREALTTLFNELQAKIIATTALSPLPLSTAPSR